MTQLTKRKRNGNGNSFPSFRNGFFTNRFLTPRFFDLDDDFFDNETGVPPANIVETNKEFKLDLSVPGMKKDDFTVDVEDGVLTISSEKEEEQNESDKNYRRREFSYSSFSRTFSLPENVDENKINAKYDNGMLQITIPKNEMSVSKSKKQITVG
jgi:HSP20 family protein